MPTRTVLRRGCHSHSGLASTEAGPPASTPPPIIGVGGSSPDSNCIMSRCSTSSIDEGHDDNPSAAKVTSAGSEVCLQVGVDDDENSRVAAPPPTALDSTTGQYVTAKASEGHSNEMKLNRVVSSSTLASSTTKKRKNCADDDGMELPQDEENPTKKKSPVSLPELTIETSPDKASASKSSPKQKNGCFEVFEKIIETLTTSLKTMGIHFPATKTHESYLFIRETMIPGLTFISLSLKSARHDELTPYLLHQSADAFNFATQELKRNLLSLLHSFPECKRSREVQIIVHSVRPGLYGVGKCIRAKGDSLLKRQIKDDPRISRHL